jgi:DeoR/GlpR family transcriptional regulator of sugar metabolism
VHSHTTYVRFNTMDVRSRRRALLDALGAGGEVLVRSVAIELGCSEMTIRRDLDALAREGVVRRTHGGAVGVNLRGDEEPYALRALSGVEVKQRIGQAAADLIMDGEAVVLDSGTTTLEIARALRGRPVTVLPLGLRALMELADDDVVRLIALGGEVRPGELVVTGDLAQRAFDDLRFDTFLLGCCGIGAADGVTTHVPSDASVKKAAIRSSRRTIAVADGSKLGRVAFARVCDIGQLNRMITDIDSDPEKVAGLEEAGLSVSCV